ncbi:C40 family peptidase [Dickeya dadantii]|uniref:C40 family peptidase n=1 Tax=Dickeya dadantii TaxID=204038 RepID=UPI0003A9E105|nr:C40 family peptidase [Dickeya dadantii]
MLEQECIDYAAGEPGREVCGLVVNDDQLVKCRNIHSNPAERFRISDDDWLKAEAAGEITAVFHSHPGNSLALSGADRQMQITTALPWWLVSCGVLRKFCPVPHLLGRQFEHGVTDCYTLFRDAYHLCGIDLPDFERVNGWWVRGENLYLKNLTANGFRTIARQDIQPGDVIIRRPFPEADPCHAMIYLGGGQVLHHDCAGRLSRREPYRPAYVQQTHSIWRHEQCSSLNLQGIYADISAKSY